MADVRKARKNLVGQKFNRLTVKSRCENNGKKVMYRCMCDCGKESVVWSNALLRGTTKSCGCLRSDAAKARGLPTGIHAPHYSHGYALKGEVHPLWNKWSSIKARCYNENVSGYKNYGGRGIVMCQEWKESSAAFIEWCLGAGWAHGLQIDRIDNNQGYSPENCRFATPKQNSNNRRSNRLSGDKTIAQISRETGIEYSKLRYRLTNGFSLAEASKNEDYRRVDSKTPRHNKVGGCCPD